MSDTLIEARDLQEAVVKLADAANQIAIVVEEIGYYASQYGYRDVTDGRRARWSNTLRKQRDILAELLPE